MKEQLLERKLAIKNRIAALSKELQPHLRAEENLRRRIDELECDLRSVMDEITNAESKLRNELAHERASRQQSRTEWVPSL